MTRYRIRHIQIFVCVVCVTKVLACVEHATDLPELDRRSRIYKATGLANDPLVDDFYLNDGWYSVNNQNGQYALVDKIPQYGVCGTNKPIYLKDPHPDIATLGETPIDVLVCVKDDFEDCALTYTIQIRFCDNILHYNLVTTMQYSAFCFDPPELQSITDIAPAPTDVNLQDFKVVPELNFKDIPVGDRINFDPFLEFKCSFQQQGSYFYTVTWYLDGKDVDTYGPTDELDKLKLKEETVLSIVKVMGFNLICGVRVSKDQFGLTTRMESSEEFFAGIKIPNPVIDMDKSGSKEIELIQTVPIGCRYSSASQEAPCFLRLAMADPKKYECLQGNIVQESATPRCGLDLQALKKKDPWDPNGVKYTFKVTTKDENYEDRNLYKLHLETAEIGHTLWRSYKTSEIQVNVKNSQAHRNRKCYSHIDPHMRTADGNYYENQRSGDFMLYRNKLYDIQVQERLIDCYNSGAWCACGLGVRAGGDIFMINLCAGTVKFIDYKICKDGGTLTVIERSKTHYEIITPIGTRIDAKFYNWNSYMNIDITMAPKDMGNTEGLCGFADGNKANDFRKRDGTNTDDSQSFAVNWRLLEDENVFNRTDFPRWSEINNVFCVCEQAFDDTILPKPTEEAVCAPSMDLICKRKRTQKDQNCIKMTQRKRSISNKIGREIERKLNAKVPVSDVKLKKRQTISQNEARAHCIDKINGSLAFTRYSDETAGENPNAVIEQCEFDVLAADDLAYASVQVDAINTFVDKTFEFMPGYVANNRDTVTYFKQNSCQNNCSERGNCNTEGICECNMHFHGPKCEIDERIAPTIIDTEGGGECDLQDGDGCGCLSFSTNNLLLNFTCQLSGEIVYDNNETEAINMIEQVGRLEDIFTGICCVPESRGKRTIMNRNTFAIRYDLSISNNGENYGDVESIFVLDSACQTSTHDQDGTPIVELKPDMCFIMGKCVESQTTKNNDDCFVCDPKLNQMNWTHVCIKVAEEDNTNSKTGIIVGTTAGLGVALCLVLLSVLLWKCKVNGFIKSKKSVGDSSSTFKSPAISLR